MGGRGSGEGGADAVPGGGDGGGSPPGAVQAQSGLPGCAGDPGGHVQDPVAECGDLAAGHVGFVGEADEFAPGDQVGRGEHDLQPGVVGRPGMAGQVPQAGRLGLADAVLDPGVLPVPQIQSGQLAGHRADRGVGDERGDAVPVVVGR